ncbi:hypothetical protein [Methanobrevibacter arboriphilus]|uniref:hypothetical protein n=1 Tax=Methanobrevibacter arboriphilus TaxID=39441 RepID=UPI000A8BE59C|nr:hypothetical protein [Methanobrevibacter arboriphilus]
MSIEKEDEIKEFIYQFTKTGFEEIFDSPLYRFVVLKTRKKYHSFRKRTSYFNGWYIYKHSYKKS